MDKFIQWYNDDHLHSICHAEQHISDDIALLIRRDAVYEAAKANRSEQCSNNTLNWQCIATMSLNSEQKKQAA
ncbi:MAG: hypothetical protein RR510_05160 [Morganella sp. (in: enterobacteria)]